MKGVIRFGQKGKLKPRYIGPFEILRKVGEVAYELALPPSLTGVHNVFHISVLQKYVHDPTHIVNYEGMNICTDLTYEEQPKRILHRRIQRLRRGKENLVKVQWKRHSETEATWESEKEFLEKYLEMEEGNK